VEVGSGGWVWLVAGHRAYTRPLQHSFTSGLTQISPCVEVRKGNWSLSLSLSLSLLVSPFLTQLYAYNSTLTVLHAYKMCGFIFWATSVFLIPSCFLNLLWQWMGPISSATALNPQRWSSVVSLPENVYQNIRGFIPLTLDNPFTYSISPQGGHGYECCLSLWLSFCVPVDGMCVAVGV